MRRAGRGFTLIEAAVTVAIISIVAALTYSSLERYRPRADLANAAAELQSLVHQARQAALASGVPVFVLVFPDLDTGGGARGRVVVYQDGDFSFLQTPATVDFDAYDPTALPAGARSEVLSTLDLPRGVTFGPATGLGADATLPAPYAGVDVTKACSFCASGGDHRGAIQFDSRGRATFHDANGTALPDVVGVSLSVTSAAVGGPRTLLITAGTGSVRLLVRG
jgi:prepilin-type N-terminal cleavage/methylation domain-containing protein